MNTRQVADQIGVTRRQLDHWMDRGWLFEPEKYSPERQLEHEWTTRQFETARIAARLVDAGFQPRFACWYARHDPDAAERAHAHVARIIQTHGRPT